MTATTLISWLAAALMLLLAIGAIWNDREE